MTANDPARPSGPPEDAGSHPNAAPAPEAVDVDARGLVCPLPVLRARKALAALPPGAVVTVRATDPGSVADFQAFCRQTGDRLLETHEEPGGIYCHRLRKGG